MPGPLGEAFIEAGIDTSGLTRDLTDSITDAVRDVVRRLDDAFEPVTRELERDARDVGRGLETGIRRSVDDASREFRELPRAADRAGEGIEDAFQEAARDSGRAIGQLDDDTSRIGRNITRDFQRAGERSEDAFEELSRSARGEFRQIDRAAGRTTGLFRGMRGAIVAAGTALAAFGAIRGMRRAVEEAANLEESINAVQVTLGPAADAFLEFTKTAADSVALTQAEVNQAIIPIGALLRNAGLEGGALAEALEQIAVRAADTASVMNKEVNEVLEAFGSALRGEQEPIRALGVSFDQAALEAEALEEGIAGAGGELTAATRPLAALSLILEQTAQNAGDLQNTADSLPNLLRFMRADALTLAGSLGRALIPALREILQGMQPIVEEMVPVLTDLFGVLAEVMVEVMDSMEPFIAEGLEVMIEVFEALLPVIPPIADALVEILRAVIPLIPPMTRLITSVLVPIARAFANVVNALSPFVREMTRGMGQVLDVVGSAMGGVADAVRRAVGAVTGVLSGEWSGAWQDARNAIRRADLVGLASAVAAGLEIDPAPLHRLARAFQPIVDAGEPVVGFLQRTFEPVIENAGDVFDGVRESISKFVTFMQGGELEGAWKDAANALRDSDLVGLASALAAAFEIDPTPLHNFAKGLEAIPTSLEELREIDFAEVGRNVGEGLVTAIEEGLSALQRVGEQITGALVVVADAIDWAAVGRSSAEGAFEFIVGFADALLDPVVWFRVLRDNWQTILGLIATAVFIPGRLARPILRGLQRIPIVRTVTGWLVGLLRPIRTGARRIFREMWEAISRGISAAAGTSVDDIAGVFVRMGTRIRETIQGWTDDALTAVTEMLEDLGRRIGSFGPRQVVRGLRRVRDAVTGFFRRASDWLRRQGGDLIRGLRQGMDSRLGRLNTFIGRLRSRFLQWLGNTFPTFYRRGRDLIRGLREGADEITRNGLLPFLARIPRRMFNALGTAFGMMRDAGRKIVTSIIEGIRSRVPSLEDVVARAVQGLRDLWPGSPAKRGPLSGSGDLRLAGQEFVNRLAMGMTDQLSDLQRTSELVASTVVQDLSTVPPQLSTIGGDGASVGASSVDRSRNITIGNLTIPVHGESEIEEAVATLRKFGMVM